MTADGPLTDLVVVDLPGSGESPSPCGAVDVRGMSDAVAEVVEALGHRTWTVVGHSLGAVLALVMAARRPDAPLGVGLVSPTGPAVLEAIRRPIRGGSCLPAFAGILVGLRILALFGPARHRLLRFAHRLGLL